MLKNYFKTALRSLLKNKGVSFINIFGLALALTCCLLIMLYVKDEISFDRFHSKRSDIYRIIQDMHIGKEAPNKLSITQMPLGEAFRNQIPEIKERVRMADMEVTVKKDNQVITDHFLAVDDNFFKVFDFDLTQGDRITPLKDMYSIVLSENTAKKYFGTADAVGKIMQIKLRDEFENFTVKAVASNPPQNSSISFEMLVPISFYEKGQSHFGWIGGSVNTFLLLDPLADRSAVVKKMQAIFDDHTHDQIAQAKKEQQIGIEIFMGIQPLTDIHLNKTLGAHNGLSDANSPANAYILSAIAIFILLIACINFINLSIGQSLQRSREIGIRKVVGGKRSQLIWQFLAQSFLTSLLAFLLAIAMASFILPFFNQLADKKLSLSYLADGWLFAGWVFLLLLTSLIAGFYPSIVLSSFQPLRILSGRQKLMGRNYFARGLIVFQFALAIFLLIGTVGVFTQLKYLFHQDLGYDDKQLVRIELPWSDQNGKLMAVFKNELTGQPGILGIAGRNRGAATTGVIADGRQVVIDYNNIDENFFPLFKIPILKGRNFSASFPSDAVQSVIVNETFLKDAGWKADQAIGSTISMMEENKTLTIIGVIKDYHFRSLKEKVGAQIFLFGPDKEYGQAWIRIKPDNIPKTLAFLSNTYQKIAPLYPYTYDFVDRINAKNYATEAKWKQIVSIAAILFIFISCMGLLGLVILSVEQRTKEIGIRKVLGAATARIFLLITKEFTILIGIAMMVAIPVAYFVLDRWLQDFPYRTTMHWWIFALAGISIIFFALLTISVKALRAAFSNPVKSLRTE